MQTTVNKDDVQNICIEEDEIDLRELWQTIKEGRKTIYKTVAVVVFLTLIYAFATPNSYKSEAVLIPVEEATPNLGGLGGLAAMAGVSIGGGSMTPDAAFKSLLDNYDFMKNFVLKYKIDKYYADPSRAQNFVFALDFSGLYELFHWNKEIKDYDEFLYKLIDKKVVKRFTISSDKETSLITVSYLDEDRKMPKKIIELFLDEASRYLVENRLKTLDAQLRYFEKELGQVDDIDIRQNLSKIISQLMQEKIKLKSKRYYQCDVLSYPYEPYIKDKAKPKRALILVVSFITSIILGVFLVFFMNFIREGKTQEV